MRLACLVVCGMAWWVPGFVMGQEEDAVRRAREREFPPMPVFAADSVVHVVPSTMPENSTLGEGRRFGRWVQRGFTLRQLIADVYRVEARRVEFVDEALANRRYDVSTAVRQGESEGAIAERVKEALGRTLHLRIVPEMRTMDVYVVSSPQGAGPGMKAMVGAGGFGGSGLTLSVMRRADGADAASGEMRLAGKVVGAVTSGSLTAGGPVSSFCRELEGVLDRPVMDESGLPGAYQMEVEWDKMDQAGFFRRLHEVLGLVVTPGRRLVPLLVVEGE